MDNNQAFFEDENSLSNKIFDQEISEDLDLMYDSMSKEQLLQEIKLLRSEYIQLADESAEREAFVVQTPEKLANTMLLSNIKIVSDLAFSDSGISKNTKLIVEEVRNSSIYLYNSLIYG